MSRREDYLNSKITTKLVNKARIDLIRSAAMDAVAGAVRDVDCPTIRDLTLQEIAAAAVEARCHDGRGAEAGAHASLLARKAYDTCVKRTKRPGVLV